MDKLVNDENWFVRATVADQGYRLEKLINDKNEHVRKTAREKLNEQKD